MAKRVIAPPAVKNWNRELQELLDTDPSEQKYLKLRELAHDFNLTAEVYAKILISELFVAANEKTIPPSSIGGFAGGQKFICQGILFKFAVDVQLPDTDSWMYGKNAPDNVGAMKAAASELRHIVALSNAVGDTDLRVPLMALIDYRGFRLVASSLLPISSHTIVYGSDNAGFNVYAQPDVAAKFDLVAKRINLKKHNFGNVQIAGPVDIEIHKGEDDRLYVIDVARLMPPEAPELSITPHERSNYFMLLRPCLVFKYIHPLSSDAYTGFGRDNEDVHNAEVWRATRYLQTILVPEMARALVQGRYRVHGRHLCQVLHKTGINLRYLGLLRHHIRVIQTQVSDAEALARMPVTNIPGRADSVHSGTSIYSGHSNHSASNADLNALLGLPANTPARTATEVMERAGHHSIYEVSGSGPASPNGASPASPTSGGVTFEKGLKQSVSSNSLNVIKSAASNRSASGPVTDLEPVPTPKRRAGTRSQGGGKTRTPANDSSKSEQSTPSPVFSPLSPISRTAKEQNGISKSNDTLTASIDSNGKKRNPLADFSPNSSSERLHKGFFKKTHTSTDQTSSEESSRASLTASRASDSQRTPELARKGVPAIKPGEPSDSDVLPSELSVLRDLDNSASLLILQPDRSGT